MPLDFLRVHQESRAQERFANRPTFEKHNSLKRREESFFLVEEFSPHHGSRDRDILDSLRFHLRQVFGQDDQVGNFPTSMDPLIFSSKVA